ncbi:chromophore lyase CpcT/CpeT [Parasphingorhabdus sp.]|uniref:chromophore lyase CpcT/CpeT n=1 Tax=Parasphingorhabdus sp. TaxID=2709688 RepID=UPI003262E80D
MKSLFVLMLAALMLGIASPAEAADRDPMTRDLILLTDWFEGNFDNEEQIWFQKLQGDALAEKDRHQRIHTIHRRVDLPQFGKNVFYIEEYLDNDPKNVFRQRIVIFSTDGKTRQIRMASPAIKNGKEFHGAYSDPSKLTHLTRDDLIFFEGCDVFWERRASQFEGQIIPKSCVYGEGEKRRYSLHKLWLSSDKFWRVDASLLMSDDSLHVGHPEDMPHEMRRALPFNCSIHFFADNQFSGQVVEDLSLHSQGGTASATRKSDGREFEILMREKEYPYYETRPDFIYFSLREKGQERSIGFSVNDPSSRQVGVRAESIGAFCHRDGYNFRESLELLPE